MATVVKVQPTPLDPIVQQATQALGAYTPQAMQTTAQKAATALTAPQISAQTAANQQQQQLLSNLYNRQTGFALAMGQLAAPNAQQAQQAYTAAANTMGTLGQGIMGQAGADWRSAAQQAADTAQGLTGGQGAVQAGPSVYDPTGLQSTGYTTGFALPGQSLVQQGITAGAERVSVRSRPRTSWA